VAVLLGTLGLNEPVTVREIVGMATVLLAVVLTVSERTNPARDRLCNKDANMM